MRLMESNRVRMSPCIRPYALRPYALRPYALRPYAYALALPTPHLGANPPEPIRCCRPRRRPTISDSLCRTEKQVLFSVTGLCDNHTRNLRACQALFAVFVLFFGCSPH